jgi:glutamyl-tRNA reductase
MAETRTAAGELLALGVSHKTAPIELRERLALPEGRAAGVLSSLVRETPVLEAVALSTCNRMELYLFAADPVEAETAALGVLAREAELRPTELLGLLYSHRGEDAARHLFSVTAGLDSMILGEFEIQGQVKRAYEMALVEGITGPVLNRLFRAALAAGRRARHETGISEKGLSLSSVAVELAQRTLGDLARRQVLVIGAGDTAELTARALHARGVETVFVANRHYGRAIGLAQRFGGQAVRFDELPAALESADIVLSSTSSPHQIVDRDELEMVMSSREGRPLLLIDLAVPRDVDPSCREIPGVTLHDVDDLQALVERNTSGREAEAGRARHLLESELARFQTWLASQEALPTVAALRERGEAIVEQVLSENSGRWESMSDSDRARLAALTRSIVSRLLHEPTVRLKRLDEANAYVYVNALRELFGLDSRSEPEASTDATVTPIRRGTEKRA